VFFQCRSTTTHPNGSNYTWLVEKGTALIHKQLAAYKPLLCLFLSLENKKISKNSHYAIIEYGNECDNLAMLAIDDGKTNNFRKLILIRSVTKMEFKIELLFMLLYWLTVHKQHQYLYLDFALL
jgi:hypothetical protein